MDVTVADYLEHYRSMGLGGSPCSAAEVAEVARGSGVVFPAAYTAYLLTSGRRPPSSWVGSDCTIDCLPKLGGWAEKLLAENGLPALPSQAFVFLLHQGYQFFYFVADGTTDDPPVFYYLEGEPTVVWKFERFSDLVAVCAGEEQPA
jgi:hypothetical protein